MSKLANIVRSSNRLQHGRSLHVSSIRLSSDDSTPQGPQACFFPAMKTPMLPPGTFKDRTAFITGGGTGLGRGMAQMLSSLGADVVIASRRLNVVQTTADEISAATGRKVVGVQVDVRKPETVCAALDACQEAFGVPQVVINNAAGNFISPTERLSPNAWRTVVDIVLNGSANVTLEAGRRMIAAKKGGVFLNITTPYTRSGSGFVCPSSSAKAGVEAMSKSLCAEWGRYGLRFNCVAPGPVETEGAFSRLDPSGEFRKSLHSRIPAGRMGEIEEVANLATYLVSDYSSWLSGESIALDGGQFPNMAGEFNLLKKVSEEQWDALEQMIRGGNARSKL